MIGTKMTMITRCTRKQKQNIETFEYDCVVWHFCGVRVTLSASDAACCSTRNGFFILCDFMVFDYGVLVRSMTNRRWL